MDYTTAKEGNREICTYLKPATTTPTKPIKTELKKKNKKIK